MDQLEDPEFNVIMKRFIAVYVLLGSSMISLEQTIAGPHGEGSVVFGSAGGRWRKAVITDQLTGESSAMYSLEAETGATDARTRRHPRVAFSCQQSGKFDGVRIRTGTVVANQYPGLTEPSSGRAQVSTRSDIRGRKSGLLTLQGMVPICLRMKESSLFFWVIRDSRFNFHPLPARRLPTNT